MILPLQCCDIPQKKQILHPDFWTLSVINIAGLSLGHEEFPPFQFLCKKLSHNWRKRDKKCRKRGNVCHGIKADDLKLKGRGQHHKTLQVCNFRNNFYAFMNFSPWRCLLKSVKLHRISDLCLFFFVCDFNPI